MGHGPCHGHGWFVCCVCKLIVLIMFSFISGNFVCFVLVLVQTMFMFVFSVLLLYISSVYIQIAVLSCSRSCSAIGSLVSYHIVSYHPHTNFCAGRQTLWSHARKEIK